MSTATLLSDRELVRFPVPFGDKEHYATTSFANVSRAPVRVLLDTAEQTIHVVSDSPAPLWLQVIVPALQETLELPANWDSYGGSEVSLQAGFHALLFLASSMDEESTPPSIVPTPRGEIQLEWHGQGKDIELQFGDGGVVGVWLAEGDRELDVDDPGEASGWQEAVFEALRQFHRRT